MNVLAKLDEELKGKNWTLEEKQRYLYLQSCKLFSFDLRYHLASLLSNGMDLKEKIRNRRIDLENVQDTRVICSSHTEEVIAPLYEKLLGVDSKFIPGEHESLLFYQNRRQMIADATKDPDLVRVKMGMSTKGFYPVNNLLDISEELKRQDEVIHYIEKDYHDFVLKEKIQTYLKEHPQMYWKVTEFDSYMIQKLAFLSELFFQYSAQFLHFSDAATCISMLKKELFDDSEMLKMHTTPLFYLLNEDSWVFLTIYTITLSDGNIYYALQQQGDKFLFGPISSFDAYYYTKHLQGKNKERVRSR